MTERKSSIAPELVTLAERVREMPRDYLISLSIDADDSDWALRVQQACGRFNSAEITELGTLATENGCRGEYVHLQLASKDVITFYGRSE
jgi:hypothetical protein